MKASLGVENVFAPKSRAVGFTWMVLALFLHAFIFEAESEFGMASENEAKVDKKGKQNTLFAKLDFLLKYQPRCIINPTDYDRGPLRLCNLRNDSVITGYPSTSELNRGGRDRAFLCDEAAAFPIGADYSALNSLRAVTDSIFMVSTYGERDGCAFNNTAENEQWRGKRIFMTWKDCPPQAAGMYRSRDGVLEIVDQNYPWPRLADGTIDYPFILDGKERSPYYDEKTAGLTPQAVAREYDVDRKASSQRPLPREQIERLAKETPQKPRYVGVMGYDQDDQTPHFEVREGGMLSIWCELLDGAPSREDVFSMGVDTAAGFGGSNSVLSVWNRYNGEQVAEWVWNWTDPIKFANIAKAVGLFFKGAEEAAYMVPEVNGTVGTQFMGELERIGYPNLHRRETYDEITKRRTRKTGWHNSAGIGTILGQLLSAANSGSAKVRSSLVFKEMLEYVFVNGQIKHGGVAGSPDESESDDTHGDAAGAAAMAWLGCKAMPASKAPAEAEGPPVGSIAWYREQNSHANRGNVFSRAV